MASGAAFLAAAVLFLPELGLLVAAAALGDATRRWMLRAWDRFIPADARLRPVLIRET